MIQPSAVRCLLRRATAVLVGRERSPGTVASSDTADPAAALSPPGLSWTLVKGSGFSFVFSAATVVLLLGHLLGSAYLHARCAFDLPGKRLTGAPLSFLGLSGYRYFVFSFLRPALFKYIYRHGCYKTKLFQRQTSSNCLHHLFSLGLGHPQQQEISPKYNIR